MKLFSLFAVVSSLVIFLIEILFFGAGKTTLEIILRSIFMGCIIGGLLYFIDKKRTVNATKS